MDEVNASIAGEHENRGMHVEAIRLASSMPALCPHCGHEKTKALGLDVCGNVVYYRCPGCGNVYFGKVSEPALTVTTYRNKPPNG